MKEHVDVSFWTDADETKANDLQVKFHTSEAELASVRSVQQMALRAAGSAHDLGNLLTIALGHLTLLAEEVPAEIQASLKPIQRAMEDGQELVRRILARPLAQPANTVTAISTVVYEALMLVRPLWLDVPDLTVDVALAPTPEVAANPLIVRQVLINLLLNAFAVMPKGGTLKIRSDVVGPLVSISITDTGPGLTPDVQATLFAPLMSGRLNRRGLGLVSSRALITEAGGSLTAVNTPGSGATFTLTLPIPG